MKERHTLQFAFSDFQQLLRKNKKTVIFWMFLGALLCFLLAVTRPVVYLVQGSFRDKAKMQASISSSLTDLIFNQGISHDSEAASTMKSRFLISEIIKKLNAQGEIIEASRPYPQIENAYDNLWVEWAYWTNSRVPVLKDLTSALALREIDYPGEVTTTFELKLEENAQFSLQNLKTGRMYQGQLDQPIQTEEARFSIVNPSEAPLISPQTYYVVLKPMSEIVKKFGLLLSIVPDQDDKTLLKLQYRNRDRHFAVSFLNALMDTYQSLLEEKHDLTAMKQVKYLEQRQKEVGATLELLMNEYVQQVSSDMAQTGFTSLQAEMDFLAANLAANQQKLTEIELDIKRLQGINCKECAYYDASAVKGAPEIINHLLGEIRTLKQQADALSLALQPFNPLKSTLEGISLETSQNLYLTYMREMQEVQSQAKQHQFVVKQLQQPDFEINALTALLQDPISHERIAKAGQLTIQLQDVDNHTQKERERLQEELDLQKNFLTSHIEQMAELLTLKEKLLAEKVVSLQSTSLELIQQKMALLEKHLSDYVGSRIDNLSQEKSVLENHQDTLYARMAEIPHKWVTEKVLDQNLIMHQKFLENLSEMVESKNITKNLELIQSAPLDRASPPLNPKPPHVVLFTLFGSVLGFLGSSCFQLTRTLAIGLPASHANLQLQNFHTSGSISRFQGDEVSATMPLLDSDLNTLRRLIAHFEEHVSATEKPREILIINGSGPDFSNTLAKLLSKKGLRTLKIQLSFSQTQQETRQGLLHYLEGKVEFPSIEQLDGFDLITPGGASRYSEELLRSPRFEHLLNSVKSSYNWIIGVTSAKIPSAEAENLAKLFNGTVIVVTDESLPDLINFSETLDERHKAALTFILSS